MPLKVDYLFDDYPKKDWSKADLPIFHLGMKLEEKPTNEEKKKFRTKCEIIEKELGDISFIAQPMIMKLDKNAGYCLTYLFKSDMSLDNLNQKFGNNIYVEAFMPDKPWSDD